MPRNPLHRGERIVHGRRETRFGRVPVVHRHDDGVRAHAEIAAERIVRVRGAEHPPATMEVRHDRMRSCARGPVDAAGEVAVGPRHDAVLDGANRRSRRSTLRQRGGQLTRLRRGQRLHAREPESRDDVEHHCHIRLQAKYDAVMAPGAARPVEREPEIVAGDHVVADPAVRVHAADVRQEHARLAWHIRAHVPRCGARIQREIAKVVDVLHPPGFGERRRLGTRPPPRRRVHRQRSCSRAGPDR
jgi:hypothetical protein